MHVLAAPRPQYCPKRGALCCRVCQASTQYVESLFADDLAAIVSALGNPDPRVLQEILVDESGHPVSCRIWDAHFARSIAGLDARQHMGHISPFCNRRRTKRTCLQQL